MIWWGRIVVILTCIIILIPVVHINAERHARWEKDSQERIELATPPRKEPKGGYRVIMFLVGTIVFFLLLPL